MSDVLESRSRERSWALSVFLGKIDANELRRIVRTMTYEDANRLLAVVNGYHDDVAIRDLIGPEIVDEDGPA